MKKIILVICLFFITTNIKALELEIKKGDEIKTYKYEYKYLKGYNILYKITFEDELKDFDYVLINNLGMLGIDKNEFEKNIIQKMILEIVNPEYEIVLKDNGKIIDTSSYEEKYLEELKKYNTELDILKYYEINLNECVTINNNKMLSYKVDNYTYMVDPYVMEISNFNKTGTYNINIYYKPYIINNYIAIINYKHKDTLIKVKVNGYKVDFNIEEGTSYIFDVYNDDIYKETININELNKTYYYNENERITLKDSTNSIYTKLDDIKLNNKDEVINIKKECKKVNISFKTIVTDLNDLDFIKEISSDISIYDINLNLVGSIKGNESISLDAGNSYYILDNITKRIEYRDIYEDEEIEIYRYFINGLMTKEIIDEIYINDNLVEFEKNNSIYVTEQLDTLDKIKVKIDNKFIELDLLNQDNYKYIINSGLYYYIQTNNIKESDEIIDESNYIEIDVPDTFNEYKIIMFKKDYYEENINNNYNFIYVWMY